LVVISGVKQIVNLTPERRQYSQTSLAITLRDTTSSMYLTRNYFLPSQKSGMWGQLLIGAILVTVAIAVFQTMNL
ncbi:MAG: hypothetical protein HC768_22875, partial [Acaryochloris sp. CRU_2_0]|nr:hypothetical protein [Acaryochloris sp. CRU_2_0]